MAFTSIAKLSPRAKRSFGKWKKKCHRPRRIGVESNVKKESGQNGSCRMKLPGGLYEGKKCTRITIRICHGWADLGGGGPKRVGSGGVVFTAGWRGKSLSTFDCDFVSYGGDKHNKKNKTCQNKKSDWYVHNRRGPGTVRPAKLDRCHK